MQDASSSKGNNFIGACHFWGDSYLNSTIYHDVMQK